MKYADTLLIVSMLLSTSCASENFDSPDVETEPLSIRVGSESKTILKDETEVCWTNDDKLQVFDENGNGVTFSNSLESPASSASFSTSLWPVGAVPAFATFCDPASISECLCNAEDGIITTCICENQTVQDAASFSRNANASVGKVIGTDGGWTVTTMKNVTGLIKLSFTGNNNIQSIDIEAIGGEPVAGWVDIDYEKLMAGNADFWSLNETKQQPQKITLVPGEGDALAALLPQTYSQGLRLTMTDSYGKKAERTVGKDSGLSIDRGVIKTFTTAVDDGLEFKADELPETLTFTIGGTGWNLNPSCIADSSQKGDGDSYTYKYTDPETGYTGSFTFVISKGADSIDGAQYSYNTSNRTIKFTKSGSWIKAPAIEGRTLESVTVSSGTSGARNISITAGSHGGDEIMASTPVPANGQFTKKFTSDDNPKTEPNTAYCINMKNGTSTWKSITFVYSKALKPKETPTNQIHVLGIGNSWTRDSYRYIYGITESAGITPVIAHAYLGGSSLANQYYGMDDINYSYNHSGKDQIVHSTYQYWLYDGTADPQLTPSDTEYGNGLKGKGVTLESILKDKPWDVIIFQPTISSIQEWEIYAGRKVEDEKSFTLARFVSRVKRALPDEVANKVKIGIMSPWTIAFGNTNHSTYVYNWNNSPAPQNQDEWDKAYDRLQTGLQSYAEDLSRNMGCPCDYYVNVGKAMYFGQQDKILSGCGFKLQRAVDNTHLAEGVSKYFASLMFAYEIFGLTPEQISYNPGTYDFTAERIAAAKDVSWAAWKGDRSPEIGTVTTMDPSISTSVLKLSGKFSSRYANSATDFTCGFEYKTGDGEWQTITIDDPFYTFEANVNGIPENTQIIVRAWAAYGSGKEYGEEKTIGSQSATKIILTPTTSNLQSEGDGFPGPKRYEVGVDEDPGQEAFADKEFIYTHPDSGEKYSFIFYGKGPYLYSSSRYYVYYSVTAGEFMFGKAGSYIQLPAIPGRRLVSVKLSSSNSKSIGIASSKSNVTAGTCISGGSKRTSGYEFTLENTELNTSYFVFTGSSGAKFKFDSIIYDK